jgi:hypothetical protein
VPRAAQHLSAVWKSLSPEERKTWKEKAENDKERYKVELAIYSGPFTLPNFDNNRPKKDPSAPKRPMSAYLDYSKAFRGQVIRENPHVTDNKEISKILGMMWNNASDKVKRPFIINELALRAKYNEEIAKWRKERDDRIAAERSQRESIVQRAIETGTSEQIIRDAEASRTSLAQQSHNTTNSYEGTASLLPYHPSYVTTNFHASEENSATSFPHHPFNTDVRQQYYHAACLLDPMHANDNGKEECSTHVQHPVHTAYQPHSDSGRCSGYDAYGSSCFQEMPPCSRNSYFYTQGYSCTENSASNIDRLAYDPYDVPLASDVPPQISQLEPYPLKDIHGMNYTERQYYPYTDIHHSIHFPCETAFDQTHNHLPSRRTFNSTGNKFQF